MPGTIHPYPHASATLSATGADLCIGGMSRSVDGTDPGQLRNAVLAEVSRVAASLRRPVPLHTREPDGSEYDFLVHADGKIVLDDAPDRPRRPFVPTAAGGLNPSAEDNAAPKSDQPAIPLRAVEPARTQHSVGWPPKAGQPVPAPATVARISDPTHAAPFDQSNDRRPPLTFLPAEEGFGLRHYPVIPSTGLDRLMSRLGRRQPNAGPTPDQLQDEVDALAVSRQWSGPRTIAVVNGKGGPGKTPIAALLAAVYARYGGGLVLAWDNNDTRGTLGWRTAEADHNGTVLDLIQHADRMIEPAARVSELAAYVHHQVADKYDVLRSNSELLDQTRRVTGRQFQAVHDVASRYYRLSIIDSGNDESSDAYLSALDVVDLIVVVVNATNVAAESARLLLHDLRERGGHYAHLADMAVVTVSLHQPNKAAKIPPLVDHFGRLVGTGAITTIPYDPHIDDDNHLLVFDALQPSTQRAFRRLGAAVSDRLKQSRGAKR